MRFCVFIGLLSACSSPGFAPNPDGPLTDGGNPSGDMAMLSCAAGTADCDGNASNGCEVNTTNDAANCGKCGFSCGGGTCANSACVLAMPGSTSYTFGDFECITTDGTNIYFMAANVNGAGGSNILYIPVGGGTVTILANSTGMRGAGLIEDGNFIYWADYSAGKIFETPKAGQTGSTRTVVQGLTNPLRVAVDANNVYYTSKSGAGAALRTNGTSVWTSNQAGGSAWGLDVDGSNLYYADPTLGEVVRVPIASSGTATGTVLASSQMGARGLSGDANNIYWTTSSGNVMMSAKSAFSAATIVSGQTNPQEITVDTTVTPAEVYWADVGATGSISKAPAMSGATATVVAPNQKQAQCVAIDSTSVYWAVYGGTQILKAPK
jgi:hypothetical protein